MPDPDTDRAILDAVEGSLGQIASPATPVIVPAYQYAAVKRLADAGDERAKDWIERIREGSR